MKVIRPARRWSAVAVAHCFSPGPGNSAQTFLPDGEGAQPQWLYPQSTVPPRHSMVHIISDDIEPTFATAAHRSGWHTATGAQSELFTQGSVENLGASTAVADPGGGTESLPAEAPVEGTAFRSAPSVSARVGSVFDALGGVDGEEQARARLIHTQTIACEQALIKAIRFSSIGWWIIF